jgi:ATP-binding cassette, subfamily B, bacterial
MAPSPTSISTDTATHALLDWRYKGRRPLVTLLHIYKGDWQNMVLAVFYFIIKHSGVWAMPFLMAEVIDIAASPDDHSLGEFWFYMGVLTFVFVQNIPTNYMFAHVLSTATRNMEVRLRAALALRFQQLSMDFYSRNSIGSLQTKLLRDVEVLQIVTMQSFQAIPGAVITLIFAIGVTGARVPEFLLFFLLTIPISVALGKGLSTPIETRNRVFRQEVQGMSARLVEMLRLIPVTRAHGVEDNELERVGEKLDRVRQTGRRLDMINALFGASAWVSFNLFEVLCLGFAVYSSYTGLIDISVGEIVMLTGFFRNLTNSVVQITTILPEIAKGFESIHSIAEVLESPDLEHNQSKTPVQSVRGHFVFENVSFRYPDSDEHAIRNFSLEVHPDETIAFVGPSGAGKSTVLNLIIGFVRPSEGQIRLDAKPMSALDLRTYRRHLSVVPQETVLFEGTIRDNILYGPDHVDGSTLRQSLQDASALDFVEALPNGIDTLVGENGARLSGGQRQRLAIARALIRNPRVLVLDEATSALDSASEAAIQQALERLMQNRTTFVVAHRLSTIQKADRIVVMDKGRIVEIGTHTDLLERDGLYARLNARQRMLT